MNSELGFDKNKRAAEMIKNADFYDLIKISMKASSNKISAMDRYIQRAMERQNQSPERAHSNVPR